MEIKIYTTAACPYCRAAKDLLRGKGLAFEEIVLSTDEELEALVQKTGWQTVPQIFVEGKLIGGFEELKRLAQDGRI